MMSSGIMARAAIINVWPASPPRLLRFIVLSPVIIVDIPRA